MVPEHQKKLLLKAEQRKTHRLKMARRKHERTKQKIEEDYKSDKLRAYETPAPIKRR